MCAHCHADITVRGAMGEMGLTCLECHMPETSGAGERHTHLFRINTAPLAAVSNWKTEKNDSNKDTKYWMNFDGTTDANGDSFLTVDMVCAECHQNMTLEQMAKSAKYIHREPGVVDITANGADKLQSVNKNTVVSVNFSVRLDGSGGQPQAGAGQKAEWWVISQGPKGWSSWDGKKWKSGLRAWRKNVALTEIRSQNVFRAKLSPGGYTYWVHIYPTDGSEYVDSVPIYVTKR